MPHTRSASSVCVHALEMLSLADKSSVNAKLLWVQPFVLLSIVLGRQQQLHKGRSHLNGSALNGRTTNMEGSAKQIVMELN